MEKKELPEEVIHDTADHDFPDRLYQEFREKPYAWGIVENEELCAAMETVQEEWANRLRITELWVSEKLQKQGYGHKFIEIVKEQARQERKRAIILESQSCNVNAVDFYRHEGFELIGMDTCCYQNDDLKRQEVRLEFGYLLPKNSG